MVKVGGHWSRYSPGTGFAYRYSLCRICGGLWRNPGERNIIHNGRKPRRNSRK